MNTIPWICLTGRIIQDAVVCGPSRRFEGAIYAPAWRMRCTQCGTVFSATTKLLNQRRHLHTCDPETKAAFEASGEEVKAISQSAIKALLVRLRSRTPTEIGLQEARAYARRQLLDNSEDAQLLHQAIAQQDQELIDHITKQR